MNEPSCNNLPEPLVTRFAPSPTGALHVGGARTALYNWALARQRGGRFILRIEDTDVRRSTPEATLGILRDLAWLGIDWDEGPSLESADPLDAAGQRGERGPYFQSQRQMRYREYLQQLIDAGRAYKCFKTPAELDADRKRARAEGQPEKDDATESLNLSPEQISRYQAEGRPYVYRFRMPDTDITVHDLVLGEVTIRAEELEDFVIFKSSDAGGGPTFHFANVIDDAAMGVTLTLRAQEHLMNTPRHAALFDALGLDRPAWAHVPLIFNPDGSKMSKRDKAKAVRTAAKKWLEADSANSTAALAAQIGLPTARIEAFVRGESDDLELATALGESLGVKVPEIDVADFRANGYLPEVLCNYLALLGWNPGGDVERFDRAFLAEKFSIERIGRSSARFDRDKLFRFNADTIAAMPFEQYRDLLHAHFRMYRPEFLAKLEGDRFDLFARAYHPRSRTLDEPAELARYLFIEDDQLTYDAKAVTKVLHKNEGEGLKVLRELEQALTACESWMPESLEAAVSAFAKDHGLGMGKVAQPLRVALTGTTVSPGIGDTLALLGRERALVRLQRCQAQCAQAVG